MLFMHHEDTELLATVFGSEAGIPQRLRELYHRAHKLWCGPFASSGGPLPSNILLALIILFESENTGHVKILSLTQQEQVEATFDAEPVPELGPVHSPILDLPLNTPLRAGGKLGYFAGPWGNDQVRVKLDGDDKPYRRFALKDVELAVA